MDFSTLAGFPLFANLTAEEGELLLKYFKRETFSQGTVIHTSGQPAERLRLICSGRVEMDSALPHPFTKRRVVYSPGQFWGEASILQDDDSYKETATAITALTLLMLSREQFLKLMREHQELSCKLQVSLGAVKHSTGKTRTEHDLIGFRELPEEVYYGVQTLRGMENFHITGVLLKSFPGFITALAQVKKAAAMANYELGILPKDASHFICIACDEIIAGYWHEQFLVDMIQGGAGTSTNMNANEVIANRALELWDKQKGEYQFIHPNNHLNLGQSTNDVYPTAIRLAALNSLSGLTDALLELCNALFEKAKEFSDVIKMGRTQLQDAVPMTLGQEFEAFAVTLMEDLTRIREGEKLFLELCLGGTAIGTGINSHPKFATTVLKKLRDITGLDVTSSPNLIEATSDTGDFVLFSGILKRLAVKLSKVCNDLRLLSSGPRCGLGDISLPAVQPGSSIMPGKVNPVIPEVVNQVAFQVIGNDLTITLAAEGGQLQLNAFEPVIVFNLFQSVTMLTRAMTTLSNLCVRGIQANREACRRGVEHSIGLVTALNPLIGYENSTLIAKEALSTGASVFDLVLKHGLLSREKLEEALKPENMIRSR